MVFLSGFNPAHVDISQSNAGYTALEYISIQSNCGTLRDLYLSVW